MSSTRRSRALARSLSRTGRKGASLSARTDVAGRRIAFQSRSRWPWSRSSWHRPSQSGGIVPEKETIERARKDAREGKSPSTQAGEFVREEIHHVREGKHGARSTKQAIAIGLSKARRAGVRLPPPRRGASKRTRRQAARDTAKGRTARKRSPSPRRSRAVKQALRREDRSVASKRALSKQARTVARRRSAADRSRSARKAVRTKGAAGRSAAAKKAARTRARRSR